LKKFTGIISTAAIIISLFTGSPAAADEQNEERKVLFYTFIGPVAGFGHNHLKYYDWNTTDNLYESNKINGFYFNGGCAINIFVHNFVGDFRIEYLYNMNDGTHQVHNMLFSVLGKYMWDLTELFSMGTGLGIYFETPPSNVSYNGSGGAQIPLSFMFKTTFDTRLIVDLLCRYGYYGYNDDSARTSISENSSKLSYGITIGFLFKVGRI